MIKQNTLCKSLLVVCFCCLTCACTDDDAKPVERISPENKTDSVPAQGQNTDQLTGNTTDLGHDLQLIRKTMELPSSPPVKASSPEAAQAMARVFDRLNFIGMSREHVLWVLGDPETISDYGIEAGPGEDAPLIYRVDSGLGGNDYRFEFKDGRVVKTERQAVD